MRLSLVPVSNIDGAVPYADVRYSCAGAGTAASDLLTGGSTGAQSVGAFDQTNHMCRRMSRFCVMARVGPKSRDDPVSMH
jgi:hypothetical protein